MLNHFLLVEWDNIFLQYIENTFKLCDILLKYEIILILIEYLL